MPTLRRALLLMLSAVYTISAAHAQKPLRKPQASFAPYWTSEPGWDTELQLKNNLTSGSLAVTPALRLPSGEEIPLDPVTVPPNVSVSVWVNEQLLKHSPAVLNLPGSYGSVVLRFTSLSAGNLYAAAIVMLHGGPIAFRVDASPVADSQRTLLAGSREGIWWQPHPLQNDLLILSNRSEKTLTGTLRLSDAAGKRWNESLSLAARQTIRLNVHDLVATAGLSGQYGGIQFDLPANAGAVDSLHLMYDESAKSSLSLTMYSHYGAAPHQRPGMEGKPWTSYAPMLALRSPDPAVGLPSGTVLHPTVLVRNTTSKPVAASVELNWRGDSGRGQTKLPPLELIPFATQQLQIGPMQKRLGIPDDAHWALVTLATPASPDDLVAVASSYDASGKYNLEAPFSSNVAGHFAGGEWRADANHNWIMAVTNSGQKPTNALLLLHYDGGGKTYEMQQAIQPGEQMWVNVASLIRNRVPDRNGNVLPADASFGTYDLRDLSPGLGSLMEGSLALDASFGFNATPPYGVCCGTNNVKFDPEAIDLGGGGFLDVGINGQDECNGNTDDISPDFTNWWSVNPAVAQVTYKQVQAEATGTTTGSASGQVMEGVGSYCAYDSVQVNVPITVGPSSTTVNNVTPLGLTLLFPGLKTGIGGVAAMLVGPPPSTGNWNNYQITEAVTTSSNTCPTSWGNLCAGSGTFTVGTGGQATVLVNGVETPVGPAFTAQDNIFYDQHTVTESTSVLDASNINSCQTVCSQKYSWQGNPVGTHTITYSFTKGVINGTNVTNTGMSKQ